MLHSSNFTLNPSIWSISYTTLYLKPSLKRLLFVPRWNYCQLISNAGTPTVLIPPTLNLSYLHLVHNHQAAASLKILVFSSTAWGLVLADLQPTWKHWTCVVQTVRVRQGTGCTQRPAGLHPIWTSVPHLWSRQSCSFRISCSCTHI